MSTLTNLACVVLLTTLGPVARAGTPAPAAPAASTVDVSPYKDHLKVLTDGKGHYVTLMPFTISDGDDSGLMFYSPDGKTFFAQHRIGGGRDGNSSFSSTFWDPRFRGGEISYRDKKYSVRCEKRTTELTALPKPDGQKLLGEATFLKFKWTRTPYSLARDNTGVYYYVDRGREDGSKDFRVWKGPKGSLKLQKMVNVVSDSNGDIFVTKAGKLRLILDKGERSWIEDKNTVKLTGLDLDQYANIELIYGNLGVYQGETLGTPCDDL